MRLKFLFFPLSLMLALVIFIWMTKPQWNQLQTQKKALSKLEQEVEKLQGQIQSLEKAYVKYDELGSDKELIANALPSSQNKEKLFAEIYAKAKESEVFLTSLSADSSDGQGSAACAMSLPASLEATSSAVETVDASEKTDVAEVAPIIVPVAPVCLSQESLSLEIAGEYLKVKNFINSLEKMNRYTEVVDLSLAKATTTASPDQPADQPAQAATLSTGVKIMVYSKDNAEFKASQILAGAAAKNLLIGQIDSATLEKYKFGITNKAFEPTIDVTGMTGRADIFNK